MCVCDYIGYWVWQHNCMWPFWGKKETCDKLLSSERVERCARQHGGGGRQCSCNMKFKTLKGISISITSQSAGKRKSKDKKRTCDAMQCDATFVVAQI